MNRWMRAITGAICMVAALWPVSGRSVDARLRSCLSAGETRDALQSQKLVQPFHAMGAVAAEAVGESIGIKLCRLNGKMVYEVTVLQRDGRLVYKLVDATSGAPVAFHPAP